MQLKPFARSLLRHCQVLCWRRKEHIALVGAVLWHCLLVFYTWPWKDLLSITKRMKRRRRKKSYSIDTTTKQSKQ